MEICVYKIQFNKSSYDLNFDYERLSEYEKESISELETDRGFFDFNDVNDKFILYLVGPATEIKKYLDILTTNLIDYKISDISKDVLMNIIDLESELLGQVDSTNRKKFKLFISDINDWISKNLDMDTVLDRISDVGIKSLRGVEKEFLKSY